MPARKLTTALALVTLLLCLSLSSPPHWSGLSPALAQGPDGQSVLNELLYNEQQTMYLTHLKRVAHGLGALHRQRWRFFRHHRGHDDLFSTPGLTVFTQLHGRLHDDGACHSDFDCGLWGRL